MIHAGRRLAGAIGAMAFLAGCSSGGGPAAPESSLTPAVLRSAPVSQNVQGVTLRMNAALWRDFAPISPPDGKPLAAVLKVIPVGSGSLPVGLHASVVWILDGNESWTAPAIEEDPAAGDTAMTVTVRNGPKWGPGVPVDIVVQLLDGQGASYLLQTKQQMIGRTD